MNERQNKINKDLILRERLAIERTDMAIDRTLLSFIRTALYFAIAGMTVNSLLSISYGIWIEVIFWILSFLLLGVGLLKYRKQKVQLTESKKHIGNYQLEWADTEE